MSLLGNIRLLQFMACLSEPDPQPEPVEKPKKPVKKKRGLKDEKSKVGSFRSA